jgi:predicted nucleic acid-binding protein
VSAGPVVVDASVVVEYLVALRFTRQARRFFAGLLDPDDALELWAPDLLYPEVVSALRKLVARRFLDAPAGERATEQLTRLPIMATGTAALMAEAWRLRGTLTPYDACYVALAHRLGAPLLTADERLARALRGRRPRVLLLSGIEA